MKPHLIASVMTALMTFSGANSVKLRTWMKSRLPVANAPPADAESWQIGVANTSLAESCLSEYTRFFID